VRTCDLQKILPSRVQSYNEIVDLDTPRGRSTRLGLVEPSDIVRREDDLPAGTTVSPRIDGGSLGAARVGSWDQL
jgi:hypothetical protein